MNEFGLVVLAFVTSGAASLIEKTGAFALEALLENWAVVNELLGAPSTRIRT
jgi:hypothetical protein